MDWIKVNCHTNLDLCFGDKRGWPTKLPFRPMVGDYIRSAYIHPGRTALYKTDNEKGYEERFVGKGFQLELVVVRITVVTKDFEGDQRWGEGNFERLDVELHLPANRYQSLKDFYENWYEKITGNKFI